MANAWARAKEDVIAGWARGIDVYKRGETGRFGLSVPVELLVQVEQTALFDEMAWCMEQGEETIRIADVRERIDGALLREVLESGRFDEEVEAGAWELTRGSRDRDLSDRIAEIALESIGRAFDSPAIDRAAADPVRDVAEVYIDAYASPTAFAADFPDLVDAVTEIARQVTEASAPELAALDGEQLASALGERLADAAMARAAERIGVVESIGLTIYEGPVPSPAIEPERTDSEER